MEHRRAGDNAGRIVIIGGGPAGLGAAWRLNEAGYTNWDLFEKDGHTGGLASSHVDENGFTWDLGGHVVFSHYEYFDGVLDSALEDEWVQHVRDARVWMRERFIPYPLQNNIRHLPTAELLACLDGLLDARDHAGQTPPATFAEWILRNFGAGLARAFMDPYNRKVWATDPARMSAGWVGNRVAPVDLKRVLRNVIEGRDDLGWGPNATFRFPLRGGTGRIWNAMAQRLPVERLHLDAEATRIDSRGKIVHFSNGDTASYDWLITTMPLDGLLRRIADGCGDLNSQRIADGLQYSSTHVIGVGLDGRVPETLATTCWVYFPEPELPFHRVTMFSNYSPHNVADPGRQWSLLAEVGEPGGAPRATSDPQDASRDGHDDIVRRTLDGLKGAGFIRPGTPIASLWHRRIEHAYPTPFLDRDTLLERVDPALRSLNVLSRGRFGAWKYEVGNMDHSFMQGVEAANHILFGEPEITVRSPAQVNAQRAAGQRGMQRQ